MIFCVLAILTSCFTTDVVYGDGSVVTRLDSVSQFEGSLTVDFPIDIVIEHGAPSVSFTVDSDLQKYFTIDTTGGNIAIHRNSQYKLITTEQTVRVTLPYLTNLNLTDSRVIDTIHETTIQSINLNGNSKFTGKVMVQGLYISTKGLSECALSGEVNHLAIQHASTTTLTLEQVDVDRADVENRSSSAIRLAVHSELTGTIMGSGNIELTTYPPHVNVSKAGTGMVILPR